MKKILGFLIRIKIQSSQSDKSPNGFSLIELLVAIILTFLIITPLMGFMVDVMNSESREHAKTTSEQEIQAALDYIAQDLEQAVYIYNSDGLYGQISGTNANGTNTYNYNGIYGTNPQIPYDTGTKDSTKTPVLAFWKRYLYNSSLNLTSTSTVGCLANSSYNLTCSNQDYMVYSLVVYYLVKSSSTVWNQSSFQIARWEIRDGIRDPNGKLTRANDTSTYTLLPDNGFAPFNLSSSGALATEMGSWTYFSSQTYSNPSGVTLVDYIDSTPSSQVTNPAPEACNSATEQQVPNPSRLTGGTSNIFNTGSFYACVNSSNYTARVYIRGNALARLQTNAVYGPQYSSYFPTTSIQVKGRGFLGIK